MKSNGSESKKNINDRTFGILHILSDANRLQILRILAEKGELCAREVLEFFPITQPTLSHHMNVLLSNRMIQARKSGRWVFYRISDTCLDDLITFFVSLKETASNHDKPTNRRPEASISPAREEESSIKAYVEGPLVQPGEDKVKKSKSKEDKEKKKKKKKGKKKDK